MSRRTDRLNHLIRDEMSELLRREAKDPRLEAFVTVTRAVVSADLHNARVFVSVMGTEAEKVAVMTALDAASGFLRKELGARLRLRYNPALTFCYDDSLERASRVLQVMSELATSEAGGQEQGER
jgi:ribosome-binding factor A